MKVVVGLGNPGKTYTDTRHNIGFKVIDKIAEKFDIKIKKKSKYFASIGEKNLFSEKVLLVKPTTYMNLSGNAVAAIYRNNNFEIKDLLVILDDLDLEFGTLRIREKGGSGGHRGVNSIISSLGKGVAFPRVRIGVGRDKNIEAPNYVLGKFSASQREYVDKIVDVAAEAVEVFLKKGILEAMNKYNGNILN